MAYNSTGLVVHDADAHIMETPTWLRDNADPAPRPNRRVDVFGRKRAANSQRSVDENEDLVAVLNGLLSGIMLLIMSLEETRKHSGRTMRRPGRLLPGPSPGARHLGFASQLVFNTFYNNRLCEWEHSGDIDFAIGTARATAEEFLSFAR